MARVSVTEMDQRIMSLLRADGRVPYREIAAKVGLSATAVRYRVRRLVDAGVIRITALVQPAALGRTTATIDVDAEAAATRRVAARIAELEDVGYVAITTGSPNLRVDIMVDSPASALMTVQRIESLDGVRSATLRLHLRVVEAGEGLWPMLTAEPLPHGRRPGGA